MAQKTHSMRKNNPGDAIFRAEADWWGLHAIMVGQPLNRQEFAIVGPSHYIPS